MAKKIDIRKFRHAIAILKKKGLIKGVDARSVKPTPALKSKVTKYDDVVSGKVEPIKLSSKKTKEYRDAGYATASGRVLIPKSATEKVKINAEGDVEIVHPSGFKRTKRMIPYRNLPQYLKDLEKNHAIIDTQKSDKEYWGYRMFGNNSLRIYRDAGLMAEDLFENYVTGSDGRDMDELYRHLEFVRVPTLASWERQSLQKTSKLRQRKYRRDSRKTEAGKVKHKEEEKKRRERRRKEKGKRKKTK